MTITIRFSLLVVACIFFILAAIGVQSRLNLVACGLAVWVLSLMLS